MFLRHPVDSHTLYLRIVHQTPEIQACKDKSYSAPKTRVFVKGPRVVSGIMAHLREKLKSSPQFKTNLATLGISN